MLWAVLLLTTLVLVLLGLVLRRFFLVFLAVLVVLGLWNKCSRSLVLILTVLHAHLLLVQDMWWDEALLVAELAGKRLRSSEWHWLWTQILVWVESAKSNDVSKAGELDHWLRWHLVVMGMSHVWLTIEVMSLILSAGFEVLDLLWHWWKSHSFWKIWKWVNQSSLLLVVVIEGASIAKLAFSCFKPVLAWLSFVV